MDDQFNPKRFIIRERFNFWKNMDRKPGESVQELAARIRQDSVTCDFTSIRDAQDDAMRTRFICSVNNEAVLKAIFKKKDDEVTFAGAIQIAMETEDAAKVAKETVYGRKAEVHQVAARRTTTPGMNKAQHQPRGTPATHPCTRCGRSNHHRDDCKFKNAKCNYCQKVGHIEAVCFKKKQQSGNPVKRITKSRCKVVKSKTARKEVKTLRSTCKQARQTLYVQGTRINFEVDTGAADNFITEEYWSKLGEPELKQTDEVFKSATTHNLPVLGYFTAPASTSADPATKTDVQFGGRGKSIEDIVLPLLLIPSWSPGRSKSRKTIESKHAPNLGPSKESTQVPRGATCAWNAMGAARRQSFWKKVHVQENTHWW